MDLFTKKSDEYFDIIQQLETMPDIFCLTKTWFNEQTQDAIDGYYSFHAFREQNFVKSKYDVALHNE